MFRITYFSETSLEQKNIFNVTSISAYKEETCLFISSIDTSIFNMVSLCAKENFSFEISTNESGFNLWIKTNLIHKVFYYNEK